MLVHTAAHYQYVKPNLASNYLDSTKLMCVLVKFEHHALRTQQ